MKIGSFCSGYGGLDLAVEQFYGAKTSWFSEIYKPAIDLMSSHFGAKPFTDVTKTNPHDYDEVDIVTAGFPCQPFSTAGYRKGLEDDRAIFEYIGDAIRILRPRTVVLENVSGILTLGGTSVVATLTEMGYDSRWGIVRASDVGAPHQRARWFCVATDTSSKRHGGRQDCGVVGELDNGEAGAAQQRQRSREEFVYRGSSVANTTGTERRSTQHEHLGTSTRSTTESRECVSETSWGQYRSAITRWENTLGRTAPKPVDEGKLNPWFVEWMMGLPHGWVCNSGMKRNILLKLLGNGVVPQQGHHAIKVLTQ